MRDGLNIGIIGCGWAGEKHAEAYLMLSGVKVKAVADIEEKKARNLAAYLNSLWFRDYRKMLEDPEIDAVSICLPHYLHAKVSVEAMEAGKHVLCEKPMANTLKEADVMIRASRKNGVILMIAENVRFHSFNLKIRELINQEIIGEIFLVRIFRDHKIHDYLRKRPWFLNKEKAGGGIWMAGGFHDVDALRMLIGEPEEITLFQAKSVFPELEGEDTVAALIRFDNGGVGVITESFSTKTYKRNTPLGCPSIINGGFGTINVISDGIEIYSEKIKSKDKFLKVRIKENNTFLEEIKHFVECIKHGKKPITSGEEEKRTLAVICAGYESLRKGGKPVKITY